MTIRFLWSGLCCAGLGLALLGCKPKDQAPAFLEKADRCYQARQYDQAEALYQSVVRYRPKEALALQRLGLICLELAQYERAVEFLTPALELLPTDLQTRLGLAQALFSSGGRKQSRQETLRVLRESPGNDDAIMLLTDLASTPAEIVEARQTLESCQRKVGERASFHAALGNLAARERKMALRDQEFALAMKLEPKPGIVQTSVANYLWVKGDLTNAALYFKSAAETEPVAVCRQLQLVDFKMRTGNSQEGKALLHAIVGRNSHVPSAWLYLAEIGMQEGQVEDVRTALTKLFAADPVNLGGRLLLARLRIAAGNCEQAISELERLVTFHPRSAPLYHQLGMAYLMNKDLVKALASFDRGLRADPDHVPTLLTMADLNTRRGEFNAAMTSLLGLIAKSPDMVQAYFMLADAYLTRGTPQDALATYQRLQSLQPDNPRIPYLIGTTLRRMGHDAEARRSFENTLVQTPKATQPLMQLVELDVNAGQTNAAIQRIQALVDKYPDSMPHRRLLVEVLLRLNHLETAEAVLNKAIELAPDDVNSYSLMARLYVASHKEKVGIDRIEEVLVQKPKSVNLMIQLGMLYEAVTNYDKARDLYEKLLIVAPRHVTALNNLAYLYSERFNQLDKAYDAARRAREANPGDPASADTLGWVLYKRREYPWALSLIRECASVLPEAEVLYHLGMAHYMMGEEVPARSALELSLRSSDQFRGRSEAEKWLAFLKVEVGTNDQRSVALLEARLQEEPNDSVALRRLAEVWHQRGQTDKALALYERVLKQNPRAVVPLLRLAEYYGDTLHQADKALEYAKRAHALAPEDPVVTMTLGRLAYQAGDHKWALSLLQGSLRKQPNHPELLYDLGLCYYAMGRITESEATLHTALDQPGLARTNEARLFLEMAALAREVDRAVAQQDRLGAVLKTNPLLLPALYAHSEVEERRGRIPEAIQSYQAILAGYSEFLPAIRRLGLLYEFQGDDAHGFPMAKRAREAYPSDMEVSEALGRMVYRRGDYAWAAQLFRGVVENQPKNAAAHYYLGLAQVNLRNPKDAKRLLTHALELDTQHKLAPEARLRLKDLK